MQGIAAYKEHVTATQSKGGLVVMLYEGAIRFLKQAIAAIEAGDTVEKGRCMAKARAIVDELDTSLDLEVGGELAVDLRRLYGFMRRHLAAANAARDAAKIRDVISLLEELNEGWKAVTG